MNPLRTLGSLGQSVWLDHFEHDLLDGELANLIEHDGLKGLTSNPSIFQKALSKQEDYAEEIRAQAKHAREPKKLYERLAVREMQAAADQFRPLFDTTQHWHGWVSLEVDPRLAYDTAATIDEARRLHEALARPNVFIKVPATAEGLPAIEELIAAGIPVNVTLLFGIPRYVEVADAFMRGLESRAANGGAIDEVRSVASFFLSRIDSKVDPLLQGIIKRGGAHADLAEQLYGQVALASAKLARRAYDRTIESVRWRTLAEKGARAQWLLWGSTSTKNPSFDELKYIEPLIGPETVNTMPPQTLAAYREHGSPAMRLYEGVENAELTLQNLALLGIDIQEITQKLEDEGVQKFIQPFESLLGELEQLLRAA